MVRFEPLRVLPFGSISGSLTAIGIPLQNPNRVLKIVNTCNTNMLISYDGVDDNDIIPAGGFTLYDLAANRLTDPEFLLETGTQIWVRQESAPSSGNIYVVSIYNRVLT